MKIFSSVHEGLHNVPKLYGTEVRSTGKVTDFKSGVREGGKSLVHGYYDGITGLVREPVKGGKKEGFVGVLKGSARGMVNATMLPAAGIAGFISQPFQGAMQSMHPGAPSKAWERQLRLRVSKTGWTQSRTVRVLKRARL
ncbi:hypothetical protein CPB85DRAFT_263381 [Mucidula mucida]|nr:hypothetical protein CPB85DRAFT_263381 [Mucidula mucida]